jgi:type I restriction enzyme S subunit
LGSGNFAFNDLNTPIFAGYHTLIARPKGLECPKYIAFFMSSVNYRRQIQSLVNGVKVYSIGRNIIKKSTILLPRLLSIRRETPRFQFLRLAY